MEIEILLANYHIFPLTLVSRIWSYIKAIVPWWVSSFPSPLCPTMISYLARRKQMLITIRAIWHEPSQKFWMKHALSGRKEIINLTQSWFTFRNQRFWKILKQRFWCMLITSKKVKTEPQFRKIKNNLTSIPFCSEEQSWLGCLKRLGAWDQQ